jgi:hypothetical protein
MLVVVLYGVILLLSHHQSMWIIPGSSKKNSHPVKLIAKKLARPLPPIQCCYIALLGKAFKKKQAFRFGCRHALGNNIDQGGVGGSGVV